MVPVSIKCDLTRGVCFVTAGNVKLVKMPSDVVSLVTTGLGVSLVAGILSGVAYVLAHNVGRKNRSQKKKHDWYCEICGTYLHTTKNILNEDLVTCAKCGLKVCTQTCAKFMPKTQWMCKNCLDPQHTWFQGILKAIQPSSLDGSTTFNNMVKPEVNPDLDCLQKLEKEQVRDFIEKLVNVMLGEDVDNASVGMLYNDRNYLPVTGTTPCTAHAALKQLIQKLLKEAVNLPLLQTAHAHPPTPQETATNNSTYEDLLATAIINKVVTGCQNNLPTSSANSVSSSRHSTSSRHQKESKEYFFGEETLDTKWKTTDLDTTSVSSLDEWLQSESSFGSRKYVDKVTLMIKQDIEEAGDAYSDDDDEDDAEYFRSASSMLSDSESNWFLQKKQFQGTHSPVPVPMLVPNPTADAKVLIGDKPVDDTSDLSDAGSDIEELVEPQTTHTLLLKSKNIIGGGKVMEIVETADVRSESSTDSGVKEVNGNEQKGFDVSSNHRTDISLDDDNIEDSSYISVYSNTEKEAEYTEKYASLPRQILRSSTPLNGYSKMSEGNSQQSEESFDLSIDGDFEFTGGNYSKKEKEKWKHAVEMENNPYSKENIERRIKRSGSAAGSIFGPDYYARLAGKPSGRGKELSSGINGVSWPPSSSSSPPHSRSPSPPPPELPKVAPPPRHFQHQQSSNTQEPTSPIEIFNSETPPAPPKSKPPPKSLILDESDGIHQALKAIVTPVEENMPQNTFEIHSEVDSVQTHRAESYSVHMSTSEITSDSDLSFVNFYDVEHSQVIKTSKNEDVVIPIKAPALYKSISEPDHVEKDENHNEAVPVAKPRIMSAQTKENGYFIKNSSTVKQRKTGPVFKRNLSESSLIEDSFDGPPKVLHQKKDNTIISKIYKDPKVRLYAMNSREDLIGSDTEYNKIAYRTQRSYDAKEQFLAKARSGHDSSDNSEYESGKTGKMSFFSSEEDLLSLSSEANKNEELRTIKVTSPKKFVYGSNEDLLFQSGDELNSIPQLKDNANVSKTYQVASIRNFALETEHTNALANYEIVTAKRQQKESEHEQLHIKNNTATLKKLFSSYEDLSSADISLEPRPNSNQSITIEPRPHSQQSFGTLDLEEITKKHVVRQTLGKFSKSEFTLNESGRFQRGTSREESESIRVSVRDLRKKFESCDMGQKPVVSSLTARSLSTQIKESLKQ